MIQTGATSRTLIQAGGVRYASFANKRDRSWCNRLLTAVKANMTIGSVQFEAGERLHLCVLSAKKYMT
jgi:hypothetical protein